MNPIQRVEVLRACCCVAGADGKCSGKEGVVIQRLAAEVGVGRASLVAMIDRAQSDPDFYKEQFRVLKGEPKESMMLMMEVAMADGEIEESEIVVLRDLAGKLEIPDDFFNQLLVKARTILSNQQSNS